MKLGQRLVDLHVKLFRAEIDHGDLVLRHQWKDDGTLLAFPNFLMTSLRKGSVRDWRAR